MVNSDKSIFEYDIPPFVQVGAVLILILIFILLSSGAGALGISDTDSGTPWLIAVSLTFFFTIGNSVMSLAADNLNKYWWQSILSYVLLAFLGGGVAYLFSGDSMDLHGSYKWLYVMFAMGHIFFLALIRTMRKIVTIAKEQDSRLRGED
ncbi:MAG: hypothetical protein ACI86M_000973 [Saprospiraceae bacterium]|jgi:hypothetical protein